MVKPGAGGADGQFGPDLSGDEGIEDASEQVAVTKYSNDVTARPGIDVHRSFHGAEDRRNCLPFVQKNRLGQPTQRGVGIGGKGHGFGRLIEPDNRLGQPSGGGGC